MFNKDDNTDLDLEIRLLEIRLDQVSKEVRDNEKAKPNGLLGFFLVFPIGLVLVELLLVSENRSGNRELIIDQMEYYLILLIIALAGYFLGPLLLIGGASNRKRRIQEKLKALKFQKDHTYDQ